MALVDLELVLTDLEYFSELLEGWRALCDPLGRPDLDMELCPEQYHEFGLDFLDLDLEWCLECDLVGRELDVDFDCGDGFGLNMDQD